MTKGDTDAQIVESPITTTKVAAAMDTAITNTSTGAPVNVTSFNQGRSILITTVDTE